MKVVLFELQPRSGADCFETVRRAVGTLGVDGPDGIVVLPEGIARDRAAELYERGVSGLSRRR